MHPVERIVREFLKGCSNTEKGRPQDCQECLDAFIEELKGLLSLEESDLMDETNVFLPHRRKSNLLDYTEVVKTLINEVWVFEQPYKDALLDSLERNGDLSKFGKEYPQLETALGEPAGLGGFEREDAYMDVLIDHVKANYYLQRYYNGTL